jgi:hypothetical protein
MYAMDMVRRKLFHKNTGPIFCACGTTPINPAPIKNNKKCPKIYIQISLYGKGSER